MRMERHAATHIAPQLATDDNRWQQLCMRGLSSPSPLPSPTLRPPGIQSGGPAGPRVGPRVPTRPPLPRGVCCCAASPLPHSKVARNSEWGPRGPEGGPPGTYPTPLPSRCLCVRGLLPHSKVARNSEWGPRGPEGGPPGTCPTPRGVCACAASSPTLRPPGIQSGGPAGHPPAQRLILLQGAACA